MTEIPEKTKISETEREFVLRWGDMGGQWGVNRSVAQTHALLFLKDRPMHAEEISEVLGIARSNVSNSIKELMTWNLIERAPIANDRRDHFIAITDVMTMVRLIVQGRMEREINPAMDTLTRCINKAEQDSELPDLARQRLVELHGFMNTASGFYEQMSEVSNGQLEMLMKAGKSILKFIPGKWSKS